MMLSAGAFGCYNCSKKKKKKKKKRKEKKKRAFKKLYIKKINGKKLIYPNVLALQTWDVTEVTVITSP